MSTYFPKEPTPGWVVVDATGQTVGRLATQVASVLRGKHKPDYTPHQAGGDFVIIVNAEKIHVTGRKAEQKEYDSYSGYSSGRRVRTFEEVQKKHPERIIEHAVRGMIPRNTLGRAVFRKLKVYAGPNHPHEAQKPEPLEV